MRKARWLIVLLMFTAAPASADIGVLRPLGENTRDSGPGGWGELPGGTVLFAADDGVHGRELWRTDGTAAGTAMVADLTPGAAGSDPSALTVLNRVAYFSTNATDYWRSDGTATGTRRFYTVPDDQRARDPRFELLGDEVVFGADQSFLRITDGTSIRRLDVRPEHWHVAGGSLYYADGHDLYRSDGRNATVVDGVRDVEALLDVGDHLVVNGGGFSLLTVAPGAASATLLTDQANGIQRALDGRLYFGSVRGMETWAPGETPTLVHDIRPSSSLQPVSEAVIGRSGDRLFYAGATASSEPARLYTVGPDGARQIGAHARYPSNFFGLDDGRVLFDAADEGFRYGLWISDGTEAGTYPVAEPYGYTGKTLARATHGVVGLWDSLDTGRELFRYDATTERLGLLVDINRRTVGSDPSDSARVGDRVVFKTDEQQALWVTDGTYDGTKRLLERDGNGLPLDPFGIASDDETGWFAARDGIYRTDGTPAGTARITDIGVNPKSFTPLARVGDTAVFTAAKPSEGSDLWRTDGTAAGTQRLTTGAALGSADVALDAAGTMLVMGWPGLIWATDGTAAGSRPLFPEQAMAWRPEAVAVDDGFLAGGGDGATGNELWHLDSGGANPRLVKDIYPGAPSSFPAFFGQTGNRMLFAINRGGREWQWQTMDLATEQIEPMSWLDGETLDYPATVGGVTYIATYTTHYTSLYRTDGTQAATQLLHRFDGDFLDVATAFTQLDGVTYFVGDDDAHGVELWRTDGTPAGTRLERDIVPGTESSYPSDLVATDHFLFFSAYDEQYGYEPWRITAAPKGEDPPPVTIAPLPTQPGVTPAPPRARTAAAPAAKLTVRTQRLKRVRGATRWRVTGSVSATACSGRVQVLLGRRERVLKRVSAPLRRCRFTAVIATTSRSEGRWLQVRTVRSTALAAATSRRVRV